MTMKNVFLIDFLLIPYREQVSNVAMLFYNT